MNDDLLCVNSQDASHRLVLLHGWGADAEDLIPLGRELSHRSNKALEVVALRAPHPHDQGIGRQWYGLFPADWAAVPKAISDLQDRLKALASSSIPLQKTVLLGFSQGGAMALASGCSLPLAGLIGCSAYPHPGWIPPHQRPAVFLTHGNKDEVVPSLASEQLMKSLNTNELEVELFRFDGGHEIPQEIMPSFLRVLNNWLI